VKNPAPVRPPAADEFGESRAELYERWRFRPGMNMPGPTQPPSDTPAPAAVRSLRRPTSEDELLTFVRRGDKMCAELSGSTESSVPATLLTFTDELTQMRTFVMRSDRKVSPSELRESFADAYIIKSNAATDEDLAAWADSFSSVTGKDPAKPKGVATAFIKQVTGLTQSTIDTYASRYRAKKNLT
jgi:hypothetical protein